MINDRDNGTHYRDVFKAPEKGFFFFFFAVVFFPTRKMIFVLFPMKHILCVLIRSASTRRF